MTQACLQDKTLRWCMVSIASHAVDCERPGHRTLRSARSARRRLYPQERASSPDRFHREFRGGAVQNGQRAVMARPIVHSVYHRGTVALILVLGTLVSVLIWRYVGGREADQIHAGFLSRAQTQATVATQRLRNYQEMVYSLRDTFLGQEWVTRQEFNRVAQSLLQRHAGVQALEWVQIQSPEMRAIFEKSVSAEFGHPIVVQRRQADGTMRPAPYASEYFVIAYVEPYLGNESVLGYDAGSSPTAPLLAATRTDGQFKVSPPFRLKQSSGPRDDPGVIFILPFARPGEPANPVEGFVEGVFHVQTMLAQSHLLDTNEALDSYYLDLNDGRSQPILLYANLAGAEPLRTPGAVVTPPPLDDPADFHATIKIGDRQWLLIIRKNPAWAERMSSRLPTFILIANLTSTALLALFIGSLLQRTGRIEREVQERTSQLRASETRLQDIIDHSPALIFLKDLEGRYALWNRQFATTCQKTHEEILGQRDDDLFPSATARLFRENDARVMTTGHPMEFEETVTTVAGLRTCLVQKFPLLDEHGRAYALCGIATDITDRKQAEQEKLAFERNLLETQKLESLGVMAGGIAHDFNNILTAVLGNAYLARMGLPPADPSQANLSLIEKAGRRAADLCSQMLAYAGKGKLSAGPVDLSGLVRDTTAMLRVSIRKNCTLDLQLTASLPPVQGDAAQLNQIVMNLVINASDAIGERPDGTITLTTFVRQADPDMFQTALHQPKRPPGLYVGLEVRDNGCGMAAETIARIFEPFFTTKFSGRGLGLSAVLGIVQGHRGALFVESQPGQGSTFRLLLPTLQTGPGAKPVEASPCSRQPMLGTVLVVDDEEDVLQVTGAMLQQQGATVLFATNGSQALELYQQFRDKISLILLDLTMPGLSGEEVLRRLQQLGARQKILVMSGYSEEETMQRCAALGAVGFLRKPFEVQAVVAKLQTHIS
jgi:PAS domain S-box-containing protein